MIKVVDSNYLNSPDLYNFLTESEDNFVVLTEYAAIEAYKGVGEKFQAIYESMEILSKFPNKVLISKAIINICGMELQESTLPDSLIDKEHTRSFGEFCSHIEILKTKPEKYRSELLVKQQDANWQMDRIKSDAPKLLEGLEAVKKLYTANEIKKIRNGDISENILNKMIENTMTMTAILMRDHPSVTSAPEFDLLPHSFLFRQALCFKLLFFRWVSKGSPTKLNTNKIVNDIIDMNFATFALYFDGLLTNDRKLMEVYQEARGVLYLFRSVVFNKRKEKKSRL